MKKSHLGLKDLQSALRVEGNVKDVEEVGEARLERSGEISVLKRPTQTRIIDVSVADGVQTVRIEVS